MLRLLLVLRVEGGGVAEASHSYVARIPGYRGNGAEGCGECCDGMLENMGRHVLFLFESVEPQVWSGRRWRGGWEEVRSRTGACRVGRAWREWSEKLGRLASPEWPIGRRRPPRPVSASSRHRPETQTGRERHHRPVRDGIALALVPPACQNSCCQDLPPAKRPGPSISNRRRRL